MPNDGDDYLDLDEARREGKLAQFIRERRTVGDESIFDRLLRAMAGEKPPTKGRTSKEGTSED